MRILRKLLLIAPVLAVLGAVLLGASVAGAQERQAVDLELSITNRDDEALLGAFFRATVRNNSDVTVRGIRVQFKVEDISPNRVSIFLREGILTNRTNDGTVDYDTLEWTVPALRPGSSALTRLDLNFSKTDLTGTSQTNRALVRFQGEIVESTPREAQGQHGNNRARHYVSIYDGVSMIVLFGQNLNYGVDADPGTDTFTVRVTNRGGVPGSWRSRSPTQYQVRLKVTPSQGLRYTATPSDDTTTFDPETGIWDIGTLITGSNPAGNKQLDIRVAGRGSLAVPEEDQCLTVEIEHMIPDPTIAWLPVTACMAHKALVTEGDFGLFSWYDCLAESDYPCDGQSTLELVSVKPSYSRRFYVVDQVHRQRFRSDEFAQTTNNMILRPEEVLLWVPDNPQTRRTESGNTAWSALGLFRLYIYQDRTGFLSGWSDLKESVTVSGVDGAPLPGRWVMGNTRGTSDWLDATDNTKVLGSAYQPSAISTTSQTEFRLEFGALGTYVALFEIEGTKASTTYTDSGTYTFHVGPIAELEVRDEPAHSLAEPGRQAYTIVARNHGPDTAPAVRVTLTGVPEDAEAVASQGSYAQGACQDGLCQGVWTIGEMRDTASRFAEGQREEEVLTIIPPSTGSGPITATIKNNEDYTVCIDGDGDDVVASSQSVCEATSGNTWHTAEYYDYLDHNTEAEIAQRPAPSSGPPGRPAPPTVSRLPSLAIVEWEPMELLNGFRVTHYEVQRSASPWEMLDDDVKGTVYLDMQDVPASVSYRVRAVNQAGGHGPWSLPSATGAGPPGPPLNLLATADGRNRINLEWDQPAVGAEAVTGYRIDYTPAGPETWATLEHGYRTSPRSYQHTRLRSGDKLEPGQEYCYRVAATYAGGTGSFGARACATTEAVPAGSLPGEPENLRFAQVGRDYVTLEWDPPSAGGKVEYYKWRSNIHEPKKVTPETATSVTVRGLAPSWSYGFQVLAGNESNGDGRWSREIQVTLNLAGGAVKTSPLDLEVDKGGSGSFNVALNRAPQWPLMLYLSFEGPACLTESLPYQQGKILLPTNPSYPSKEFWEDPWWGPPEDRLARPWNRGLDILVNASGCQGGETAVVDYDLTSLPFSYLEGLPMWEELGLDQDEWRDKWGTDRLDGISGPSVKVTVTDDGTGGNIGGQQGSPGAAGQPTAVTLGLDAATVSESAGQATLTATLDAPAPEGGIGGFLFAGADGTASPDIDFTMPFEVFIPGGQRSATATIAITGDDVDEADETVVLSALFDLGTALLEDKITLTIADDDTAGLTVSAASGLAVDEGGTASYTVVLDSQPTADVTVMPTSDDPGAATVSPASHVFTPSGWNTAATFTVSGQVDEDTDDESVGISHWITSDDWRYAIVPVATVPVSVSDTTPEQQQQGPPNQAPTVAIAISDAAIVNESAALEVSLNGVFSDPDGDALTITAASGDEAKATVSVAGDYSSLTVTAQAWGTATITVTADDGKGVTVDETFTVTVKAAPVVASAIADLSLEVGGTQDITLSSVFTDPDGDDLTFAVDSTDPDVANPLEFHGTLTIIGGSAGSATVTVTARDSDGNVVSDQFDVAVTGPPTPVVNLRCVAETDRVIFLWDTPEWSDGETYAYDYELTLPDGRTEAGRLIGLTLLRRPGEYRAGSEASFNVKTVYELADGSHVSSADATLTCTVAE